MTDKKACTHRAYALKREGQQVRWLEIGVASMDITGKGCDIYLDRLPVGGFNGYIKVRPNEAPPDETAAPQSGPRDE